MPRGRQDEFLPCADTQLDAQPTFEPPQLMADRRLRDAETIRRRGRAAGAMQLLNEPKIAHGGQVVRLGKRPESLAKEWRRVHVAAYSGEFAGHVGFLKEL